MAADALTLLSDADLLFCSPMRDVAHEKMPGDIGVFKSVLFHG